jgi:hypothetical protein
VEKKPKGPANEKTVIDLNDIYVSLGDLADSVAPHRKVINIVAEIGINIIKIETENPKNTLCLYAYR